MFASKAGAYPSGAPSLINRSLDEGGKTSEEQTLYLAMKIRNLRL